MRQGEVKRTSFLPTDLTIALSFASLSTGVIRQDIGNTEQEVFDLRIHPVYGFHQWTFSSPMSHVSSIIAVASFPFFKGVDLFRFLVAFAF